MKASLIHEINRLVLEAPDNGWPGLEGRFFEVPLLGVASAADPRFERFKEVVGPQHLTPTEAFALAFPGAPAPCSVVSVAFPIAEAIRRANAREREWAAPAWAMLRSYGDERFLRSAEAHLVRFFEARGHRALISVRMPEFQISQDASGPISNWSERHVAFAAGLGTFSWNDGFITEKGMAIRLLSLVTDAVLEPDLFVDRGVYGNCLMASGRTCGACIKRCPVGALSDHGHDKRLCLSRCYGAASKELAAARGGIPSLGNGCGLCQTGVPCEARNPMRQAGGPAVRFEATHVGGTS